MSFRHDENIAYLQKRIFWLYVAIAFFLAVVVARLFFLQIQQGDYYLKLATEIFVREEEVVARRGRILDREGKVLAETRAYFEITVTPQYVTDQEKVIAALTKLLPLDAQLVRSKIEAARFEPRFRPIVVAEDIPYEWVVRLSEYLAPEYDAAAFYPLSGVAIRSWALRQYLYPELFAHAMGYLREIDKDTLAKQFKDQTDKYSMGDLIGASGLEKSYDDALRGRDGQMGRVVDARGREVTQNEDLKVLQNMATFPPVAGYDVVTALDFDAQEAASKFFSFPDAKNPAKSTYKKGAAVAIDPKTGAVIVLYSSPGYDANRITKKIDKPYWQMINLHPDKFLYDRAIQAMYPPGSTYKPVTLVSGLKSGVVDPLKTHFNCGGGLQFGNRYFKCWNKGGHGSVGTVRSLGQSCDVFFYNVGVKAGVDTIAKYADIFGFGRVTGIDIPFEKGGLVPSSAWKEKRHKQKWIESETLSISIGQGYDLVTPLQNAKLAAMIANGGYEVTPHLGYEIRDRNGAVVGKIERPLKTTDLTGDEAIVWAQKGMIEVVHGAGTAKKLKASPYKIAGKTGTAQVIGHDSGKAKTKHTEDHGLFIAYAPYDDPKIAVSVIVENGRGGSLAAAPVAMAIIDTYLGKIMPLAKDEPVVPKEK
jgi:penicillin-binding protein 2